MWRFALLALLGAVTASAQVPYARIRAADREPGSWLTYSGTYDGHRFSPLAEITPANVARLRPEWVYQVQEPGPIEATPLVADGVMYLTEARSRVAALDLRTGRTLWRYEPSIPKDVRLIGFGPTNRGVALLDDRVYVGTLDAHLVALDAASGAVRWNVVVADNALGYAITSAPLAIDGRIVIGVSGGEAGIRGFIDAYDAKTGARAWRFQTVPGPGEPGHETWAGDSWKTGGAPTWLSGSLRPGTEPALLGDRQSRAGLERRPAPGRQPVLLLAGGARRRHGDSCAGTSSSRRTTRTTGTRTRFPCSPTPRGRPPAQARGHGEPQRLLLRAGPDDRRVPPRRAVRHADLGARARRRAAGRS